MRVGEFLMNKVVEEMKNNQIKEIMAYVSKQNPNGCTFLKKVGYNLELYLFEKTLQNVAVPTQFEWRYATDQDLQFVMKGLTETYEIEGVADSVHWEEEVQLCKEGLEKREVILALNPEKGKFNQISSIQSTVKSKKKKKESIGLIWFSKSKSPFVGVLNTSYPETFCWILLVFTVKGEKKKSFKLSFCFDSHFFFRVERKRCGTISVSVARSTKLSGEHHKDILRCL